MAARAMTALAASGVGEIPRPAPRLSTDYLNRFSEALMLIEMAPMDPEVLEDLRGWRPLGYREHFMQVDLRCAPAAVAAFDALDEGRRRGFEALCAEMDEEIRQAIAAIDADTPPEDCEAIAGMAACALRAGIERAALFINGNGERDVAENPVVALQSEIDALFGGGGRQAPD